METTFSLKEEPRSKKILISKKLYQEVKLSIRKIAKLTGIPMKSVARYVKSEAEIGEGEGFWSVYDTALKKMWLEQDAEILAMAQKRIKEELPKAKLYQAIGAYKVVREANQQQNNTNINLQGNQMAVQVIRGNVSYNSTEEEKLESQAQE